MDDAQARRLYELLGQRLREARKERGFTQENVADDLRIKRVSIANFEKGRQRLPIHTVYGYAKVVGLPIARLFPSIAEVEAEDVPAGQKIVQIDGRRYPVSVIQAALVDAVREVTDDRA